MSTLSRRGGDGAHMKLTPRPPTLHTTFIFLFVDVDVDVSRFCTKKSFSLFGFQTFLVLGVEFLAS